MKQWIARKFLARFSRRYSYDVSYMEAMLAESPAAFFKFGRLQAVSSHRSAVPLDAYFATKLIAAASADCGPCTQLCVEMAREAGMPDEQIAAVLEDRGSVLDEPARVGAAFARALASDRDALAAARDRARALWGEAAVVELSLAFATAQVYPVVKTGMGYGELCRRVRVDTRAVEVSRPPAAWDVAAAEA